MFGSNKKENKDKKYTEIISPPAQKESSRGSNEAIASVLSNNMTINGELSFQGKARIDGTVQGDIKGDYLILSESGSINGDMELDTLVCHGRVEGNIEAKVVTIHATSYIHGRLSAQSLTVEPGARLTGEIRAADSGAPAPVKQGALGPRQKPAGKPAAAPQAKVEGAKKA